MGGLIRRQKYGKQTRKSNVNEHYVRGRETAAVAEDPDIPKLEPHLLLLIFSSPSRRALFRPPSPHPEMTLPSLVFSLHMSVTLAIVASRLQSADRTTTWMKST
ncbi:hypothetical protein R1flu_007300 [Riccia fluitans]|uniref:Uncharacterized protein n=1 Tax=Riccia fluitans TaxID=41844 RepID=A0ABD1YYF6_9MARC